MSFTIKGSGFLGTTRCDAFHNCFKHERLYDVLLAIKGEGFDKLYMREEFFEGPPQHNQRSNGNDVLPQKWSLRTLPNHQFPENLPQVSGNVPEYILWCEPENVSDPRPGPSRQNRMQVAAPAGRLERDDGRSVDNQLVGQIDLLLEDNRSIYSVASGAGTELVSADDLLSDRGSNQNIADLDAQIPEGSNLSFAVCDECYYKFWKCHKIILAMNSPLLEEFLETATNLLDIINPTDQSFEETPFTAAMTQEGGRKIMQVEVKDVSESSMESILTFIYTGELSFQLDNFAKLLHDADKLQFSGVRKLCQDFLINEPLDASNCITILSMSYDFGSKEGVSIGVEALIRNLPGVLEEQKEEDIRRLPLDIMEKIMNSDEIVEANAEDAFKMLIIWADGGQGSKTANLNALMKPKIGLLSLHFLLDNLANPDKIQLDYAGLKLVNSTMKAKLRPPESLNVSPS